MLPIKTKEFAPLSQAQVQALIAALVGDQYEPAINLAISTASQSNSPGTRYQIPYLIYCSV